MSSQRNTSVFKTDLCNDSDNDERFSGFLAEDIMLREAVADLEFDVNKVSSVPTSDWRKLTAMVIGMKISRKELAESANAAD